MKNLLTFFLLLLATEASCQQIDKQTILEHVFKIKEIEELLHLQDLSDRGPIRVIDRTTKFKGTKFLFKLHSDQSGLPINVGVTSSVPIDLNTGHFRDIIITKMKKNGNYYTLDLYLSNYLCYDKKKNRLHFEIMFSFDKQNIVFKDISFAEWD